MCRINAVRCKRFRTCGVGMEWSVGWEQMVKLKTNKSSSDKDFGRSICDDVVCLIFIATHTAMALVRTAESKEVATTTTAINERTRNAICNIH